MTTEPKNVDANYELQKKTTIIISFIGISFMIVGGLNFIIDIPVEFIIGVSFAGFFFIWADFIVISNSEGKPPNENYYFTLLFLAVSSFILLPLILPSFPRFLKFMADSSESVSIVSLGFVLIIINFKMFDADDEFLSNNNIAVENNEENINGLSAVIPIENKSQSNELIKRSNQLANESQLILEEAVTLNISLIKLIEEAENLDELKEEVEKYK